MVSQAILIILGAFGVFLIIFGWSWILLQLPRVEYFWSALGASIIASLIFGIFVTSGLNKDEKKKREW